MSCTLVVEGRWQCRPPRCALLFSLLGASCTLLRVSHRCVQFPESVRKSSGRSVSFNAQPLWERRSAPEGATTRAGISVPRVRTLPVDVPAASWECWDHGVDSQAVTPRKGDQPQNWRATDPRTSGHQPQNWTGRRYFLTLAVSSRSGKSGLSWCPRWQAGLPQVCPR